MSQTVQSEIEIHAVHVVNHINDHTNVETKINTSDTEKSYDGEILLEGVDRTNPKSIAAIPVQVKGTTSQSTNAKFNVGINDLKNYANNGVIFYYVTMQFDGQVFSHEKIYYLLLTSKDASSIAKKVEEDGKGSTSLQFKSLANGDSAFRILHEFYKKQSDITHLSVLPSPVLINGDVKLKLFSFDGYSGPAIIGQAYYANIQTVNGTFYIDSMTLTEVDIAKSIPVYVG